MGFNQLFLRLMSTQASWLQFTTNNGYGEPGFNAGVTFLCHVTYKRTIIRSDTEEDRVATAEVQCPPPGWVTKVGTTPTITIYDHIVLPFDSLERKIIDVRTYTDAQGLHHQSLVLE